MTSLSGSYNSFPFSPGHSGVTVDRRWPVCFLTRGVCSGAGMATVKETYYLFEKSVGVWSVECGSVAFPSL